MNLFNRFVLLNSFYYRNQEINDMIKEATESAVPKSYLARTPTEDLEARKYFTIYECIHKSKIFKCGHLDY